MTLKKKTFNSQEIVKMAEEKNKVQVLSMMLEILLEKLIERQRKKEFGKVG